MPHDQTTAPAEPVTEAMVTELVHRFYDRARRDPLLGPVFETAVRNWDGHLAEIETFWSSHLRGTGGYKGSPFMAHVGLKLEPESFDRWLALFGETAREVLPAPAAERALAKANHMAGSLKAGLFTIPGRPYQTPR
ncbi:MAG TPA: group III truncated hemoglobin [Azospirillum sp.]